MQPDLGLRVLEEWLDAVARDPSPYRFGVTDLTERDRPSEEMIAHLGQVVIQTKANPAVLERMATALGWEDASARLRPSGVVAFRRGDFGEALATEILGRLEGYKVPVRKLRYQTDPEQTMHGTDIVAFEIADTGQLSDLHFVECKLRTTRDLAAGTEAHNQLADDRTSGYADTLMFIADRLIEIDPRMFEALHSYLSERERPQRGSYGIFLICDGGMWDEDILARVDEIENLLEPLSARAAHIEHLGQLVERCYDSIGAQVIGDGY